MQRRGAELIKTAVAKGIDVRGRQRKKREEIKKNRERKKARPSRDQSGRAGGSPGEMTEKGVRACTQAAERFHRDLLIRPKSN